MYVSAAYSVATSGRSDGRQPTARHCADGVVRALFPYLPKGAITVLEKYPLATVEEIPATPNQGLHDLRGRAR